MDERAPGDRLLYFVLIPAVVLAVIVLGVLALRTTLRAERARQQAVVNVTATLAVERAAVLDNLIVAQDNAAAAHAALADYDNIGRRWLPSAARETPSIRAMLVLDLETPEHEVMTFVSRAPSPQDDEFRRLLTGSLFRQLELPAGEVELRHLHTVVDEQQILISYWQRRTSKRRVLLVVWHDVERLVRDMMPQIYREPDRGDARMNVVDERGRIVFGQPLKAGVPAVGQPFPTTLYNWRLQVALTSAEEVMEQAERRRLIEFLMVIVAGIVTVFGLFFVVRASLTERRLSSQKSDFVANVSHELKTPLSLIRMFGELLLSERVASDAKRKQYLSIIVGESERLTALIENVLDFARVERGKASYEFVDGSLAEVAARAVEIYKHRAEREQVELELEVDEGLPTCRLDPRAAELAVMNLIDNALKYAKDGLGVRVHVTHDSQWVSVDVTDAGPGIPLDEQRRIFERFYRGASADAAGARGSGIGLALVSHIAESHAGRVRVESPVEAGRGARFSFSIPLSKG